MSFSGFLTASASATQPADSSIPPTGSAGISGTTNCGLNTGAKAGIAIGAAVATLLLTIIALLLSKRAGRKSGRNVNLESKDVLSSSERPEQPTHGHNVTAEGLEQEKRYVEMDSNRAPQEVRSNGTDIVSAWRPA